VLNMMVSYHTLMVPAYIVDGVLIQACLHLFSVSVILAEFDFFRVKSTQYFVINEHCSY
jgi:hypothetical protein